MKFGPFDIPEEELLEACKRLERARDMKPHTVVSLDTSAQAALIQGSGGLVYSVGMRGCECVDFERRQLPCKHIYRLALDLGYEFPEAPIFDPVAASEYDISEDLERLHHRWISGQLTTAAYEKCFDALHASASTAQEKRIRALLSSAPSAKRRPGRPPKTPL